MKIGNYDFNYIETIELNEKIKKDDPAHPVERYKIKNTKKLPLHEEGSHDFCKFKLKNAKDVCGVYAWVINNEVVYIGEAKNIKKRFNTGYGIISPRNCYQGGQKTNCKMNNVVYETYKNGDQIDIYFLETKDYKAVEKELLLEFTTKYNVKNGDYYEAYNNDI